MNTTSHTLSVNHSNYREKDVKNGREEHTASQCDEGSHELAVYSEMMSDDSHEGKCYRKRDRKRECEQL